MWIAEDAEQKLRVGWATCLVKKQGYHALRLGTAPGYGMAFPEIIQTWMVVFRKAGSGFTCLFPIALWKMPSVVVGMRRLP